MHRFRGCLAAAALASLLVVFAGDVAAGWGVSAASAGARASAASAGARASAASAGARAPALSLRASPPFAYLGQKVTLTVKGTGRIPTADRPAQIRLLGKRKGTSHTSVLLVCRVLPCRASVAESAPAIWQYQAVLYAHNGTKLARSPIVTVQWSKPPPLPADYVTITTEQGTSGLYISGASQGRTTCTGAGEHDPSVHSDCDVFRAADGGFETATATVNGVLPHGDTLWLTYDGGYGSTDPNYHNCDPAITSNCVLAKTSTGESVSATVNIPNNVAGAPDYIRGITWGAEIVNSSGAVWANLFVVLCGQGGGNSYPGHPGCG